MKSSHIFLCTSIFVLSIGLILQTAGYAKPRRIPDQYLIPYRYVGWMRIYFNQQGKPPLHVRNGYRIVKIPTSGYTSTSSSVVSGWAIDQYLYVRGSKKEMLKETLKGGGGMIWEVKYGRDWHNRQFKAFFVGNEKQWRNATLSK